MNRLKVITSPSLTSLAATLADDLAGSFASVLERETVVVLNPGMARWISMELATSRGVCAGLDFRFPNEVIDNCFNRILPNLPTTSPFTRDAMTWRIAARLPGLMNKAGFEQIAGYLGQNNDDRRLLQISRTLADLFDQYIIFRPEMVLGWDRGEDNGWQSVLWRELTSDAPDAPPLHRAALLESFRKLVSTGVVPKGVLPRRISLFGISYLPPFHLKAFSLLAQFTDIVFYLQNPCGAYWGDIVSRQRLAELALADSAEAAEYYDTGNPLLSSLGTMGQEFHDMLLEFGFDTVDLDREEEEPCPTLLNAIKHDIRNLLDRGGSDEKGILTAQDRSLQIHSCHGPLREMEVLYDNLLAMFDELDSLEPRQIVVMIPDMESYAPYIAAVFGAQSAGRPAIPFSIADRSQRRENPVVETFFRILGLPTSRFGVRQILELLESPPVLARFNISTDEMEDIREWLRVTGVRWGFDAQQRVELGFPLFEEFSWQAGMKRLFLGYALTPDNDRMFCGTLPFESIEGRSALALGKLADFIEITSTIAKTLESKRSLLEWADTLTSIVQKVISPERNGNGLKVLFSALQTLREAQEQNEFNHTISLEAIKDCLSSLLDESSGGYGFLGGRVTFCAMLPMRSIPFRVVCLAGMNDGIFPRNKRQPAFSLMSGKRRRGDRSLRDEDRYLFLETIMAAKERLYISYTGQSDRDNSVISPSVVVSELQDYVERGFTTDDTDYKAPAILVRHRLQAFSKDYFTGDDSARLFSYSTEYRDTLQARQLSRSSLRGIIKEPLSDDPELLQEIDFRDLKRFLANPSAAFLVRRMNIRPHTPNDEVEECEPFAMDNLTAYGLSQELVKRILSGTDSENLYEVARAKGLLPPLTAGHTAFEKIRDKSVEFARMITPYMGDELEPLSINFKHDEMVLSGCLNGTRSGRNLHWRCAGMKARDRLSLWVDHLILNALAPAGYPRESLLVCSDLTLTLAPLNNAVMILNDLLNLYREGLRRPIPFFPQVSWLYLTGGMEKAENRWNGGDHALSPPESEDPSHALCFRDAEPLDLGFEELARRVFEPLRAIAIEEKVVSI